jgi:peptidoglycan/xylan/chitin deacetylase (PgdA/CDA1 family)
LNVRPQHFAEHLEVLREYARPMRLQQLAHTLLDGHLPNHRSVIVTFDDGYAENFYNANPLLERYDIPATVFPIVGLIGQQREPWWDELDQLLLQTSTLPEVLRLTIKGNVYQWELDERAYYTQEISDVYQCWTAWDDPPTVRHLMYRMLTELLHPLSEDERRDLLDRLQDWAGVRPVYRPSHRPLSLEEVVGLGQGGLVEFGAHTVTHPTLSTLQVTSQQDEILTSKRRLEDILGRRVVSFAYPYGSKFDYTAETIRLVQQTGFSCACSSLVGSVGRSTDRFQLPRTWPRDWDGEEFATWLLKWFDSQ